MQKERKEKSTAYLIIGCVIATALYLGMVYGILVYAQNNESEAKQRQATEEALADVFVGQISSPSELSASVSGAGSTGAYDQEDTPEAGAAEDTDIIEAGSETKADPYAYSDTVYHTRGGVTFTPDYAMGSIDCVLEIPSINLRRGVYTGTQEEINHDLDIWMAVTARADYELGKTHYVIYGHNYPVEELSFNRLTEVRPPDYFTLSANEGVYFYEVTEFFADWRENVTANIVDNFSLPKDSCYILSCGRNEYRYKDVVVVGRLLEIYDTVYWAEHKSEIISEFKNDGAYIEALEKAEALKKGTAEQDVKEKLLLVTNTLDPKDITVSVLYPNSGDDGFAEGVTIGVFDQDGFIVLDENEEQLLWEQKSEIHHIRHLPPGEYVIGIYKMDEENEVFFDIPEDLVLTISETAVRSDPVSKIKVIDYISEDMPIRYWTYILIGLATLIWIALLAVVLSKPKKH